MPKQLYKIVQFHGGLNSNSDARDIAENELSEATDIMVDELGKIRLIGGLNTHGTIQAQNDSEINPGYGLFQFSHDRIDGHTAGSGVETGADYMAFSDPDTQGTVDIYSNEDDTWGSPITGMTNNSSGLRKDVFYAVDGALRICDSDFGNSNSNKWYGYVDRTHSSGLSPGGSADAHDTWTLASAEIAAPTRGIASIDLTIVGLDGTDNDTITEAGIFQTAHSGEIDQLHLAVNGNEAKVAQIDTYNNANSVDTTNGQPSGITDWTGDNLSIHPPAGTGFNIEIVDDNTTVSPGVTAGTYEVATTFIYDAEPGEFNAQESLPFKNAGVFAVDALDRITLGVYVTSPYSPRITGGRVYIRLQNTEDPWNWIADISLKDGVRIDPLGVYTGWTYGAASNANADVSVCMATNTLYNISGLLPITYELNTGISQSAPSITAKYKTAVVANRVVYIGNVQYDGVIYSDSIFQSPVNKFDIFTKDTEIAASISDGDSIVKLEIYADRILQFKKKKMQIINISQYGSEFLEDTFMHKGVSHPAATCKTDFGIAWVNKQGCYLYDGQKVNNLLEKGGRQIIKESDWDTFATNQPMIGYIPKKRQLLVVDDNSTTGTVKIFLYDLVTQSWIKGADGTLTSQALTNFVIDWNGDLVYAHTSDTGTFVKWDDAAETSTSMVMSTKDIDFGNPGQKKTVYKVIVTYQSSNATTNVQVDYGVNGDTTFAYDFTVPELPAANGWQTAELVPDVQSEASNIKSFRLRFATDGTVPAGFEINDVSIVYRLKGAR